MRIPQIVVVGGGAGGLELVTALGKKLGKKGKADIHLVDQNPTHLWKPLLHEVATGSLDSRIDEVSYRNHSQLNHFKFHIGSLESIDREARTICLSPILDEKQQELQPQRTIEYDYLVLAIGSQTNDFGTEGAEQHCAFLDGRRQADIFHRKLLHEYLRLSNQVNDGDHVVLRVGIVGAGATGVELAAELHNTTALLKAYGIELSAENLAVTIIEAGPRILPALPQRISQAVVTELQGLNITVRTNTKITAVDEEGFHTETGDLIPADLKVWAAGVKAPPFLASFGGLETNRINQIEVLPSLQSKTDPRIFALGDCCSCPQDDGSKVPPRAQAAHQMASQAYKNLVRLLEGKSPQPFVYHDHGSLVSLSRYSTVGSLMGNLSRRSMMVEGRLARIVYISLYRMHQIALHGWLRTCLIVFSNRINKIIRPRLKLH